MKGPLTFLGLRIPFFNPEYRKMLKEANSICKAPTLSIQERITSIAKMIVVFQNSYGFAPAKLSKALLRLNSELDRNMGPRNGSR